MKAKADEDEYPFYCLVGNQYYECNIEGKHTQFANSYLCYGPNPNGTEWEDYIEASKFVCKYDNVPLPSHSITQKRIWEAQRKYPKCKSALEQWYRIVKNNNYSKIGTETT